jgi:hypothetical protein
VKIIRTSTVALSLNILLKGQLSFLNKHFEIIAVSGQDEHLQKVHEREKVKTTALVMQRSISPLKDLKSLLLLFRLFKKEKPQIVHSITPKAGLLSMLGAKFAGVPIRMHIFTGLVFPTRTGVMQKLLIKMDKILCWAATDIYPEGEGVRNDLINYGITKKPLKIIANGNINGININCFNSKRVPKKVQENLKLQLGILKYDFVFVFVGRLVSDKGINELVKAFKGLTSQPVNRSTDYKLLLVGPLETELDPLQDQTLNEIESNPTIITSGFQPDVRPYFAISNALVFPSYREGFPNVVMQAGAMGLPSIVTDINGCNEIIEDGKNGLIIPPKDTKALQEKMLRLMEDEQLYKHLASNSREMITSRYEQKLVWEALLNEYKSVLKKKEDESFGAQDSIQ